MTTKQELTDQLREIEEKEQEEKRNKELEKNFERFQNRNDDLIIGKAHCDIGKTQIDYSWRDNYLFSIGQAISIHGNCGTSYNAKAPITSATHTYFHNVWSDKQRRIFQEKLNAIAVKETLKIMSDLRCVLEIMGLQSSGFFLDTIYPKNKIDEIKKEITQEQAKILNKYSDKQFKDLLHTQYCYKKGSDESEKVTDVNLSHSKRILFDYIKNNRPKLIKVFKDCSYFD